MRIAFLGSSCARRAVTAGLLVALAGAALPVTALATPESELAAARSQLEEIGTEYQQLSSDLDTLRAELETTVKQVEETSIELKASQADLAQVVSSGYKDGGLTVVKLLFGSTNLNDIVSGVYYLGKVSDAKAAAIEEVKDLQASLEAKQAEQTAAMDDAEQRLNEQADNQQRAIDLVNSLDAQVRAQLETEAQQNEAIASGIQSAEDGEAAMSEVETQPSTTPSTDPAPSTGGETTEGPAEEPSAPSEPDSQPSTPSRPETPSAPIEEPEEEEPAEDPDQTPSGGGSTTGSSSVGGAAVSIALQFQGYPYTWGGASPEEGFDCSGLVMYAYAQLGYSLPHSSSMQLSYIQSHGRFTTDKSQLQYGDLVFFPGHVAFYVGNGNVYGARRPGVGASTCSMSYFGTFLGGGNL